MGFYRIKRNANIFWCRHLRDIQEPFRHWIQTYSTTPPYAD